MNREFKVYHSELTIDQRRGLTIDGETVNFALQVTCEFKVYHSELTIDQHSGLTIDHSHPKAACCSQEHLPEAGSGSRLFYFL